VRLSDAKVGDAVVIDHVEIGVDGAAARLEHVGFLPGTLVKVERRAPLGDPTVYELRGFRLALRAEAAALVEVTAAPHEAP
jgi:ferrous iron transport protein A